MADISDLIDFQDFDAFNAPKAAKRRSSILKQVDANSIAEVNREERRGSRRVSWAKTYQYKELLADGTTIIKELKSKSTEELPQESRPQELGANSVLTSVENNDNGDENSANNVSTQQIKKQIKINAAEFVKKLRNARNNSVIANDSNVSADDSIAPKGEKRLSNDNVGSPKPKKPKKNGKSYANFLAKHYDIDDNKDYDTLFNTSVNKFGREVVPRSQKTEISVLFQNGSDMELTELNDNMELSAMTNDMELTDMIDDIPNVLNNSVLTNYSSVKMSIEEESSQKSEVSEPFKNATDMELTDLISESPVVLNTPVESANNYSNDKMSIEEESSQKSEISEPFKNGTDMELTDVISDLPVVLDGSVGLTTNYSNDKISNEEKSCQKSEISELEIRNKTDMELTDVISDSSVVLDGSVELTTNYSNDKMSIEEKSYQKSEISELFRDKTNMELTDVISDFPFVLDGSVGLTTNCLKDKMSIEEELNNTKCISNNQMEKTCASQMSKDCINDSDCEVKRKKPKHKVHNLMLTFLAKHCEEENESPLKQNDTNLSSPRSAGNQTNCSKVLDFDTTYINSDLCNSKDSNSTKQSKDTSLSTINSETHTDSYDPFIHSNNSPPDLSTFKSSSSPPQLSFMVKDDSLCLMNTLTPTFTAKHCEKQNESSLKRNESSLKQNESSLKQNDVNLSSPRSAGNQSNCSKVLNFDTTYINSDLWKSDTSISDTTGSAQSNKDISVSQFDMNITEKDATLSSPELFKDSKIIENSKAEYSLYSLYSNTSSKDSDSTKQSKDTSLSTINSETLTDSYDPFIHSNNSFPDLSTTFYNSLSPLQLSFMVKEDSLCLMANELEKHLNDLTLPLEKTQILQTSEVEKPNMFSSLSQLKAKFSGMNCESLNEDIALISFLWGTFVLDVQFGDLIESTTPFPVKSINVINMKSLISAERPINMRQELLIYQFKEQHKPILSVAHDLIICSFENQKEMINTYKTSLQLNELIAYIAEFALRAKQLSLELRLLSSLCICKLLPKKNGYYNFVVELLGLEKTFCLVLPIEPKSYPFAVIKPEFKIRSEERHLYCLSQFKAALLKVTPGEFYLKRLVRASNMFVRAMKKLICDEQKKYKQKREIESAKHLSQ